MWEGSIEQNPESKEPTACQERTNNKQPNDKRNQSENDKVNKLSRKRQSREPHPSRIIIPQTMITRPTASNKGSPPAKKWHLIMVKEGTKP
jgi:hypothetical protein